jgi:hypothetical protein
MTQGDQVQGQRPSGTARGSTPSSNVEVGDPSNIPANMLALFQQFLATMSQKEESKDGQSKEVRNDHKERKTGEKEVHTKDIPESSAQGEARATNETNGPYCYRCLTRVTRRKNAP